MKNVIKLIFKILFISALIWFVWTIWVQRPGNNASQYFAGTNQHKAAFIYDPDPLFSFDKKIGLEYSKALQSKGWSVFIYSVKEAINRNFDSLDLMILCANTYNWAPDRSIISFLDNQNLVRFNVAAATVGLLDTRKSQILFEAALNKEGVNLIDSKSYCLLKSNGNTSSAKEGFTAKESAFQQGVFLTEKLK